MLGAVQGDRMIVVLGGAELNSPDRTVEIVRKFVTMFGPGAVIVGPPVEHLMDAATSTREAVSAYRAAAGWPEAPRPVTSHDLLPERALSGDGHARRALAHDIYEPLQAAGGGPAGDTGHLPGPGTLGGSSRTGVVRSCQHRPLSTAAHS